MRVAVLGAGAMGAIFGSAFARAGAEVAFFDKRPDVVEAIQSTGLVLEGVLGATTARYFATTRAAELAPVDLALVLVDFDGDRGGGGGRGGAPRQRRLRAHLAERHRQLGGAGGPARP